MKQIFQQKKFLIITYLFLLVWGMVVFLSIKYFQPASWIVPAVFLLLIFWPGFSLSRIFKLESPDLSGQLVLWLATGFVFLFLLNFLAISFGWTLPLLIKVYLFTVLILFILAMILDFRLRPTLTSIKRFKLFQENNFIYLIILLLAIFVLAVIDQQGAHFKGDPSFHLSLMRKVIDSKPLTINNLSYVRSQPTLPYIFPLWHVSLAMVAGMTHFSIFNLWGVLPVTLTILVFPIWYWLFKQILGHRGLASLALIIFIIFTFNSQYGYIFLRLPVPDTFAQYVLLPLSVALALKFVFDKTINYKLLILFSLLVVLMAIIHISQYFYFLLIMVAFGLLYVVINFRSLNFKTILGRLLFVFAHLVIILPLFLFMEIKNHVFSSLLKSFAEIPLNTSIKYDSFKELSLAIQLAIIALPLILVFFRRHYPRLIFPISLFLIPLVVFKGPIRGFLTKILSDVFMDRLFYNVVWYYLVWALILGFVFLLINWALFKLKQSQKYLYYSINFVLLGLSLAMVWAELNFRLVRVWYHAVFTSELSAFLEANFLWLGGVVLAVALGIVLLERYSSYFEKFFNLGQYQFGITFALLVFLLSFFLIMPEFRKAKNYFYQEIAQPNILKPPRNYMASVVDLKNVGGQDTIEFIRNFIPPKKTFDINSGYFLLPTLVDEHMSSYSSQASKKNLSLYSKEIPMEEKLKIIKNSKIDYLMIVAGKKQNREYFGRYPQYFKRLYDNGALIYQINREQLK